MKECSPDDLYDVLEISKAIQNTIYEILSEQDYDIGFSALNLAVFRLLTKNDESDIYYSNVKKFCIGLQELVKVRIIENE